MKIVLYTQDRENYAAHDWDGEGDVPQGWKFKGGDVFIVQGVDIAQAQRPDFWELVQDSVTRRDDYFESYVVGSELVDDCVDNAQFHESWETPILLTVGSDSKVHAQKFEQPKYMTQGFVGKRSAWIQEMGLPVEGSYILEYLKDDGSVVNWKSEVIPAPVLYTESDRLMDYQ